MAALIHLIKFQSTHCATARERALMMFEALAQISESTEDLDDLCFEANALLAN
ncbi:hypothetical protein ICN14_08375 [Polynucleobacter sp. MG-27-Goln-C1]|nr:hypothetical protein [Polynucleobacter sp. MG-27-Goln-C1]